MTLRDLIAELQELEEDYGDTEVHFSYNYGDHWHTMVAPHVKKVEVGNVEMSHYHSMCKVSEDSNDSQAIIIS